MERQVEPLFLHLCGRWRSVGGASVEKEGVEDFLGVVVELVDRVRGSVVAPRLHVWCERGAGYPVETVVIEFFQCAQDGER